MLGLKILTKFIDLIFENSCLVCNKASGHNIICLSCESSFVVKNYKKQLKNITVHSWGHYDGNLRSAIIALKSGKRNLTTYFANKLVDFWKLLPKELKDKDYLVLPVPSHKERIKERGYCQAALIAKDFAYTANLNLSINSIIRDKKTKYMNSLNNIQERKENIKNAFKVISPIHSKDILIIDDLLTSGSTLSETSRIIHKHSPNANIIGLTIAAGDRYN